MLGQRPLRQRKGQRFSSSFLLNYQVLVASIQHFWDDEREEKVTLPVIQNTIVCMMLPRLLRVHIFHSTSCVHSPVRRPKKSNLHDFSTVRIKKGQESERGARGGPVR
jgi:hypothetical protein